jgi:hypothetical protein
MQYVKSNMGHYPKTPKRWAASDARRHWFDAETGELFFEFADMKSADAYIARLGELLVSAQVVEPPPMFNDDDAEHVECFMCRTGNT